MDQALRTTVRCILAAYQSDGIEAQTDALTGFIEEMIRSRDELNERFQEEAEKRWLARIEHMERIYRCVTVNVNATPAEPRTVELNGPYGPGNKDQMLGRMDRVKEKT